MSRLSKSIETKQKYVSGCLRLGSWGEMGSECWWVRVSLKFIIVIVAQLCKYTKNHWIFSFKWVNCMVCALHLNKAVVLKKKMHFEYYFPLVLICKPPQKQILWQQHFLEGRRNKPLYSSSWGHLYLSLSLSLIRASVFCPVYTVLNATSHQCPCQCVCDCGGSFFLGLVQKHQTAQPGEDCSLE